MKIYASAIVSNSDMNKNYRACREKAEIYGRIYVLKNNQPEAVLFSVAAYERISKVIEYLDNVDEPDIAKFVELLQNKDKSENQSI